MIEPVKRFLVRCAALAVGSCLTLFVQSAAGQEYPTKIISLKVGYSAGGPADAIARQLQQGLQTALGQTVIVENVPGAGGSLAAQAALRLPADGHSVVIIVGNDLIVNPLVFSSAKYKPTDFKLIHPLVLSNVALVTGHDNPPADFDAVVTQARAANKELSFGNWGTGSMGHLISADFANQTGIRVVDVPYKGSAPMLADLIGKQIDYAFQPLAGPVLGMIESGKLKTVGIASDSRVTQLPKVMAAGESKNLKNFNYMVWIGAFVLAGTPQHIVTKLNSAFSSVVNGDAYQKWSRESGNRPMIKMDEQQASQFFNTEYNRATNLARSIKITPQ